MFPYVKVVHGSAAHSDHLPIIMETEGNIAKRKGIRPFRFEVMQIETEDYEKVIENSCNSNTG